ncbi:chorismate mutase family protein [Saccharopolyspora sp. CA-218241]|uniref:chorismate mutase family protein n=1 Tax=Saccharopolyspora sp. CA-218241 TaxID=3240027 RepID=UPI003D95E396
MTGKRDQDSVLAELRRELDDIDDRLLETIRERIACCVRVAHHKQENGIPMMQPHRIGVVHGRAAEYGEAHGVDPDFLRRLYDLIIAETCRVEDVVMGDTSTK